VPSVLADIARLTCFHCRFQSIEFVWKISWLVVSFLLGKSPASVYYCMSTFRNSVSVPSSKAMVEHPMVEHPKEKKLQSKHGESLKSRISWLIFRQCLFVRHVSIFAIGIEWHSAGDLLRCDSNRLFKGECIYFSFKKWLILSAIFFEAADIFNLRINVPFAISEGIHSVYILTVSFSFAFTLFSILFSFSLFLFGLLI